MEQSVEYILSKLKVRHSVSILPFCEHFERYAVPVLDQMPYTWYVSGIFINNISKKRVGINVSIDTNSVVAHMNKRFVVCGHFLDKETKGPRYADNPTLSMMMAFDVPPLKTKKGIEISFKPTYS